MLKTALLFLVIFMQQPPDFYSEQILHRNVREAIRDKEAVVAEKLRRFNVEIADLNILIVTYKQEKLVEVWAKRLNEYRFRKMETYLICHFSGQLGPKRREFDMQVPEGFYYIDRFNPASRFFLSLGINYPNQADKIKAVASNPGSDIFIHGSCMSAGCLAMSDENIKELYLIALYAKKSGQQKTPVYIFPFRMDNETFTSMNEIYFCDSTLTTFWQTLKTGHDKFVNTGRLLEIRIDERGGYVF